VQQRAVALAKKCSHRLIFTSYLLANYLLLVAIFRLVVLASASIIEVNISQG